MRRMYFCSLAVLAIFAVGLAKAEQAKQAGDEPKTTGDIKGTSHTRATIMAVDSVKDTITVKMMDKQGKLVEKMFPLTKSVKLLDCGGKSAKLDTYKTGDSICITRKAGAITELTKHAMATITKVDAKAGKVTAKTKDKDGKQVEKTFRLMEDAEYLDSTGRIGRLEVFQSGDEILVIESEGRIKELTKVGDKDHSPSIRKSDVKKSSSK